MRADHEPGPGAVAQHTTLAADGLGDQRTLPAPAGQPQHRRVELHELQVRGGRAGPQGERDAVAGAVAGLVVLANSWP